MKLSELKQLVKECVSEILSEASVSDEAKRKGLEYYKFGRYGKKGKVTHISKNGKLVPATPNDKTDTKSTKPVTSKKISTVKAPMVKEPTSNKKVYTPKKLMQIDSQLWDKLGIDSGDKLQDKKTWDQYVNAWGMVLKNTKPVGQDVLDELEDQNFHSVLYALAALGLVDKNAPYYDSLTFRPQYGNQINTADIHGIENPTQQRHEKDQKDWERRTVDMVKKVLAKGGKDKEYKAYIAVRNMDASEGLARALVNQAKEELKASKKSKR